MRDWIIFYVLFGGMCVSSVVGIVVGIVTWPQRYEAALRAAEERYKKTGA
ncbi:MAG: hypothetical protein JO036_02765 [Candidatus Eremiobacteraeota bacterium]|nr:hypothetical protein [Candidatus Eremiobacteraeota bacterium]